MKLAIFCLLLAVAAAQMPQDAPIPYSFNYNADTEDGGSSSHQETGDGAGRVTGSYTVNDLEGHTRTVEYIADENGFRATVRTNEPGTANINPADVIMESSAEANAISYTLGGGGGAGLRTTNVVSPPVAPVTRPGGGGMRFVLVPATDPRARAYTG